MTDSTGFLIARINILQTQRLTFLNFLFKFAFFILTTLTPIKTTIKAITTVVVIRNHYLHSSLLRVSRFCFVLWNHNWREEVYVLKNKNFSLFTINNSYVIFTITNARKTGRWEDAWKRKIFLISKTQKWLIDILISDRDLKLMLCSIWTQIFTQTSALHEHQNPLLRKQQRGSRSLTYLSNKIISMFNFFMVYKNHSYFKQCDKPAGV